MRKMQITRRIMALGLAVILILGTSFTTEAKSKPIAVRFNCQDKNFVTLTDTKTKTVYKKGVTLRPGRTYEVKIRFSNYCKKSSHKMIYGARCYAWIPDEIAKNSSDLLFGGLEGTNADQKKQTLTLRSGGNRVKLSYVKGSARVYSGGKVNGKSVDGDKLLYWGKGVKLGYNKLNGQLPGSKKANGYIVFRFKVNRIV